MRTLATMAMLLVFIPGCKTAPTAQETLVGRWVGNIKEPGAAKSSYNTRVWVKDVTAERGISVQYPSLKCDGIWTLVEDKDGRFTFTERIENGRRNCTDGGKVICESDPIIMTCKYYFPTGELVAKGTLEKLDEPKP